MILAAVLALASGRPFLSRVEQSVLAAEISPSAPAYVRRGEPVEARYRVFRERLQASHEALRARLASDAPELLPKLEAAAPKPVVHGYQILPRLTPDPPRSPERPRAKSGWYSWPWTEQIIERETKKMEGLEAEINRIPALDPAERKAAYEKLVTGYSGLSFWQRTIDAHIQYNRLWQPAIANDKAGYDRGTVLHDAMLERQAVLDALSAEDDKAFQKALREVKGMDPGKSRAELEVSLREREQKLARQIHEATDRVAPSPFLRIDHPTPHLWINHVPFYTDIEDDEFVRAFKSEIERVWRLRDGEDEFRVELSITYIPASRLYGEGKAPGKGEKIDVGQHVALFPKGGAVLTTGAVTTHVLGQAIVVGPHETAPHVLAHEFGHILGFGDGYFRGYKDLGADGYQVMEVQADADDIMGAPGNGPVLRRHFDRLIEKSSALAPPRE